MVLKRSKYGLNTGNSLVSAGTGRAKGVRNCWNGATNGSSARIVKRIVIPAITASDGTSTSYIDGQDSKLMTMEQKRQLIEQIEQQLTEHLDGGMQAAIVATHNGQQVSCPDFYQQPSENGAENQENRGPPGRKIQHNTPYGSSALEQPNLNRQSSIVHAGEINYSGNKKKRWELMDEVKQALRANNIDLDTFRGRIIAYTNIPTSSTANDNNKLRVNSVSTFIDTGPESVRRVGKHDVVITAANSKEPELGIVNSGEENAGRKQQSKKSRRHARQKCSANNSSTAMNVEKSKKNPTSAAPGIQLVYDFIEPLPVNNSFELGKRSYYESKCYSGMSGRNRQKGQNAVSQHLAEERLVLTPVASNNNNLAAQKKPPVNEMNKSVEKSAAEIETEPVEDNPIWGFISAALKKEEKTNKTELNRGGWIVLDILEQQQTSEHDMSNKNSNSSDDTERGEDEAEYDAFDDDNISVSTDKSEPFEKPNVVRTAAAPDSDEEDADGFVLFDAKKIQQIS